MIGIGVLEKTSKQKKKKAKILLVEVIPMHHPFMLAGCTNCNFKITAKEHACPWQGKVAIKAGQLAGIQRVLV